MNRCRTILPIAAVLAVCAMLGPGVRSLADRADLSYPDSKFVTQWMPIAIAQERMGELAAENASREQVRVAARQIAEEHSDKGRDLQSIAKRKGADYPTRMSSHYESIVRRLDTRSGRQLDELFLDETRSALQQEIDLFQLEARQGRESDLREFASDWLPALRDRLRDVERLQDGRTLRDTKDRPYRRNRPYRR